MRLRVDFNAVELVSAFFTESLPRHRQEPRNIIIPNPVTSLLHVCFVCASSILCKSIGPIIVRDKNHRTGMWVGPGAAALLHVFRVRRALPYLLSQPTICSYIPPHNFWPSHTTSWLFRTGHHTYSFLGYRPACVNKPTDNHWSLSISPGLVPLRVCELSYPALGSARYAFR